MFLPVLLFFLYELFYLKLHDLLKQFCQSFYFFSEKKLVLGFKAKFPSTRIIIDGTECPVMKPKSPIAQQATFSTYRNRNTIKLLVGATPGGLVNYRLSSKFVLCCRILISVKNNWFSTESCSLL
jgi:hypothetical protein